MFTINFFLCPTRGGVAQFTRYVGRYAIICASLILTPTFAPTLQAADSASSERSNQELIRQQERERLLREQQDVTPNVRLPSPPAQTGPARLSNDPAPCFKVQRVLLEGDEAQKFQWALAAADQADDGAVDRVKDVCLGSQGIQTVMRRIQNAIVARGFVTTRVLVAPQDLSTGQLTLQLIVGRVAAVRFAPDTDPRATKLNAVALSAGDILNLRDLEQSLENFKRVPTADADIQVMPAEGAQAKPGESDLVVQWTQKSPLRMSFALDDSGTRATGKWIANATVSLDHALTANDLLYISANHDLGHGKDGARGTKGMSAHYSVPFGYWLLAFNSSNNRYFQNVAGLNVNYVYSGISENNDIKLSRLVYRDANAKTTLSTRLWQRRSKNYIEDTEVEVERRRMAGMDYGINHHHTWQARSLDLNFNYRRGTGAFGSLEAAEEAFAPGASRPKIYLFDAQFQTPIGSDHSPWKYSGQYRGQWNKTHLVPQDDFSIGGRFTVRGFDGESVLSAERGWLVRNELIWRESGSNTELYTGLDHGRVGGEHAAMLIGQRLTGAVFGVRTLWSGASTVQADLFVSTPVQKPAGFKTATTLAGFNLSWLF